MGEKEYITLDRKVFKLGNQFFAVQRQYVTGDVDFENEFLSVSKGYFKDDGSRQFMKTHPLPAEPDLLRELMEAAVDMAEDMDDAAAGD